MMLLGSGWQRRRVNRPSTLDSRRQAPRRKSATQDPHETPRPAPASILDRMPHPLRCRDGRRSSCRRRSSRTRRSSPTARTATSRRRAAAVAAIRNFAGGAGTARAGCSAAPSAAGDQARRLPRRRIRRRQDPPAGRALPPAPGRKYFGTFIEYTALVGALGYANTVEALPRLDLLCIDEFELDDPGDTMVMTRLLAELVAGGHAAGRDIQHPAERPRRGPVRRAGLPARDPRDGRELRDVRIDGIDYRHRALDGHAACSVDAEYEAAIADAATRGSSRRRFAGSSPTSRPCIPRGTSG